MGLDELLICYNFLPLMADHALDFPPAFYESHGLKRMHDMDTLEPSNVRTGDIIFVKTDYIVNNHFKNNVFDNINLANCLPYHAKPPKSKKMVLHSSSTNQ